MKTESEFVYTLLDYHTVVSKSTLTCTAAYNVSMLYTDEFRPQNKLLKVTAIFFYLGCGQSTCYKKKNQS